jgi:uncharacterized protein YdhG (YjbR/CyaY superfamily)
MQNTRQPPLSIDEYIAGFSPEIQVLLQQVRATVRSAAPKAEERISYRMPAYFQNGVIVYFAAFKNHIGVFPPVRDERLKIALQPYAGPKGNLQFPLAEAIPYALIRRVVKARLRENEERQRAKATRE